MTSGTSDNSTDAVDIPLKILEGLGIHGGFERSFKVSAGRFQANRYVVGIETNKVGAANFRKIVDALKMPAQFQQPFFDGLNSANTVLLGVEDSAGDNAIFKIYLEFMDDYLRYLSTKPAPMSPFRLGIGYKWDSGNPEARLITHYDCLPQLTMNEIQDKVIQCYSQLDVPRSLDAVLEVLQVAKSKLDGKKCLFLHISEPDSLRSSFDINFYPANLRLNDVGRCIYSAVQQFDAPEQAFVNLMTVGSERIFGHISAGISRNGGEYFSVYYE